MYFIAYLYKKIAAKSRSYFFGLPFEAVY